MSDSKVVWTAPVPLWPPTAVATNEPARQAIRQPAILRFATDSFMEEFLATLDVDTSQIRDYRAQYETWRSPALPPAPAKALPPFVRNLIRSGLMSAEASNSLAVKRSSSQLTVTSNRPPKLYQPAHQRFYLVAASLICREPGLPDRAVDSGQEERAFFVVRRVLNGSANAGEYAFVNGAWQKIADPDRTLAPGEEELPLSPVTYTERDGRKRRLWNAMIPVGKREAYMGAPLAGATDPGSSSGTGTPSTPISPREALLRVQAIEPWKNLINDAFNLQRKIAQARADARAEDGSTENPAVPAMVQAARNKFQEASWYLLLDLADFLQNQFGDSFWTALATPNQSQQPFLALQQTQLGSALGNELGGDTKHPDVTVLTSLSQALIRVRSQAAKLESATKSYVGYGPRPSSSTQAAEWDNEIKSMWPDFLFPLVDVDRANPNPGSSDPSTRMPNLRIAQPPGNLDPSPTRPEALKKLIDGLMKTILDALPEDAPAPLPPVPIVAQKPMSVGADDLFVIRCVFKRPNCGPLQPPVISDPTTVFQLAAFFDPDAPARPIRIALPVDTTPAGLRKFDKNTAFVISDVLCGQIDRVKSLGLADLVLSVLPWPLHKDLSLPDGGPCVDAGVSLGMICSLSIPIVTICALILLMIIVGLLDFIFRWLPYFIMCFPLPGLKAKNQPAAG